MCECDGAREWGSCMGLCVLLCLCKLLGLCSMMWIAGLHVLTIFIIYWEVQYGYCVDQAMQ